MHLQSNSSRKSTIEGTAGGLSPKHWIWERGAHHKCPKIYWCLLFLVSFCCRKSGANSLIFLQMHACETLLILKKLVGVTLNLFQKGNTLNRSYLNISLTIEAKDAIKAA